MGAGLLEKSWLAGFYRRDPEGSRLARSVSSFTPVELQRLLFADGLLWPAPLRTHWARAIVEKLVGRGFTAVTRKGSRLAGLV